MGRYYSREVSSLSEFIKRFQSNNRSGKQACANTAPPMFVLCFICRGIVDKLATYERGKLTQCYLLQTQDRSQDVVFRNCPGRRSVRCVVGSGDEFHGLHCPALLQRHDYAADLPDTLHHT